MGSYISRNFDPGTTTGLSVAVDTNVADAQEVNYEEAAGGEIYVPSTSSITSLTFHVAPFRGGTFYPAKNSANAAVSQAVTAGSAYPISPSIFGSGAFKLVGDADGTVFITFKG